MFRKNAANKKETLLAHKEKLLQEINYYEKRIDEFSNKSASVYFGADSSDSEDGFPTFLDIGPSISELKRQDRLLKTCLQATQELTSVTVLESEVQVLVKDPDIGSEKPVIEPGLWQEVTAECRIDLVPFTILFYVHQPRRRFSPESYRGLRVQAVKAPQEAELSASVLHSLTSPADVLETLRSYAAAYRSRRGTLARLADRHAGTLYMQPREEGGFILKCGSVMQMSWRLENKTSPLAPFHHKMNFELEYMDESFLKIIRQAHHQLSDPSLQTDERTQLLSKIISTCVEVQAQDNIESDTDSKKLEKTTLDDDDDSDLNVERDKEVMAPPKSIPKRSKPKSKESNDGNRKSVKRSADQVDGNVKRAKTDMNDVNKNKDGGEIEKSKVTEGLDENGVDKNKDAKSQVTKKVKTSKTGEKTADDQKKIKNDEKNQQKAKSMKNSDVKSNKENYDKNTEQKTEVSQNSKNSKTKDFLDINKKAKINEIKYTKSSEAVSSKILVNTDSNTKKSVASDGKKTVNYDKSKKSENTGIANIKKVNNPVNTMNTDTANLKKSVDKNTKNLKTDTNVKKTVNSESLNNKKTEASNTKKIISNNSAKTKKVLVNAKETINASDNANKKVDPVNEQTTSKKTQDTTNAKKSLKSDENTKKVVTDPAKTKKILNSDSATTKKIINPDSAATKKIVNPDSATNKKIDNPISATTKKINNPVSATTKKIDNPVSATTKKIVNPNTKKTETADSTSANTIKKIDNSDSHTKNIEVSNSMNSDIPKNLDNPKKDNIINNPKNISKNNKTSKMVVKNHRNSSGKVMKSLKANIGKESKIPQKKLSPAYAAVLKQNPVRISPRMMSKFKSPSDSNIQSKLFKPVTNIPRLLKKPAPKSK